MSLSLSLSIYFGHGMSSDHSEQMSQRSQVSRMSLFLSLSLSLYLFLSIFFGHVMSSHHSEQMSQRSQVCRMAINVKK